MLTFWIIFSFVCYASSATVNDIEIPDCGLTRETKRQTSRVFGGYLVTGYDVPWLVYLKWTEDIYQVGDLSDNIGCTGSIINQNWVVTAAHCVNDPFTKEFLRPEIIRLFLGPFYTANGTVNYHQTVGISKLIVHPNYTFPFVTLPGFDIALLKTSEMIKIHKSEGHGYLVNAICLPRSPASDRISYSAAGYGQIGERMSDEKPRQVDGVRLKIDSNDNSDLVGLIERMNEKTGQNWDPNNLFSFLERFLGFGKPFVLRGEVQPQGVCAGDSGGTLFSHSSDGRFRLVGTTKAGVSVQGQRWLRQNYPDWLFNQSVEEYPCGFYQMYVDVYSHLSWIVDTIAKESGTKMTIRKSNEKIVEKKKQEKTRTSGEESGGKAVETEDIYIISFVVLALIFMFFIFCFALFCFLKVKQQNPVTQRGRKVKC